MKHKIKTKEGFNMKNINIKKNMKNVSGGIFFLYPPKAQVPTIRYETRCTTEYVWYTPKIVCRQVAVPVYD